MGLRRGLVASCEGSCAPARPLSWPRQRLRGTGSPLVQQVPSPRGVQLLELESRGVKGALPAGTDLGSRASRPGLVTVKATPVAPGQNRVPLEEHVCQNSESCLGPPYWTPSDPTFTPPTLLPSVGLTQQAEGLPHNPTP